MSAPFKPTYLFDIGNVLLYFDYRRFTAAVAEHCSIPEEKMWEKASHLSRTLESEGLSTDDFLERIFEALGYTGEREFFIRSWQDIFTANAETFALVRALSKRGHGLYLLSNTNQLHVDYFLNQYDIFEHFDGHVFSHEVGCAKPDPKIYEMTAETLGLVPEETLYLDDLEANVNAGDAFGFRSVRYEGQTAGQLLPEVLWER
ncbi:MAG: HAD family phosphatase [Verrucomicrobiota bacterium]